MEPTNGEKKNDSKDKNQHFHIEILLLIHQKHMQNGLRHGDYSRYRRYCTERLRRIKKSLYKGKKPKSSAKNEITPEICTNSNHLSVPLFCAERCWAHFMELRCDESSKQSKKKHYAIRKLKKFCVFSKRLEELVSSTDSDFSTKLEAKAYHSWSMSNYFLELKQWNDALLNTIQARRLYETIMDIVPLSSRHAYQSRIDELVISEKYCLYNLNENEKNPEDLNTLYASLKIEDYSSQISNALTEARKNVSNFINVQWLGQELCVNTDKGKSFLYHLQNKYNELYDTSKLESHIESSLLEKQLKIYDAYLLECKDAIQEIQSIIKGDKVGKTTTEKYGTPRELEKFFNYLTYMKLTLSSERNFLIFKDLQKKWFHDSNKDVAENDDPSKVKPYDGEKLPESYPSKAKSDNTQSVRPDNFIRLSDEIIQNHDQIYALEGIKENTEFSNINLATISLFKGIRSFFGGVLYRSEKKFKESSCLFYQALKYFEDVLKHVSDSSCFDFIKEQVTFFEEKTGLHKFEADVFSLSDQVHDFDNEFKDRTIFERIHHNSLEEYEADVHLINVPCSVIPIPCQPIFYDVAHNHIKWPELLDEPNIPSSVETVTERREEAAEGTGIAGYVKRWLWGNK